MLKNSIFKFLLSIVAIAATLSCSTVKYVPDGKFLLKKNTVKSNDSSFDASMLVPYLRQSPNTKWFSMFNLPLGLYNMSGSDTTRWGNRVLRSLGEAPVLYDSALAVTSCRSMVSAMRVMGYMEASASYKVLHRGKRVFVDYVVSPGRQYLIDSVAYEIEDSTLLPLIRKHVEVGGLRRGMVFSESNLEAERKAITGKLTSEGYYKFNKDFIYYEADSIGKNGRVDLTLHIIKYRASNNSPQTNHSLFTIGDVVFRSPDGSRIPIRQRVLENNTEIEQGKPFSAVRLQSTYNNLARMQAIRFTNIHFNERPDTTVLDCDITVSTRRPNTISFQPEGTNTVGDFGAAASLTYENNNIFRGSELFSVQLRGAFEAITGLEGYQNQNYKEYNVETKLSFPRIIAPFLNRRFRYKNGSQSELMFSYNMQNRPEFHRRVLSSAWRYHWKSPGGKASYRFDLVDINYVYMPWISSTFKQDYLDDVSNRNAILRYNYEDLFILRTGLNFVYNNSRHAIRSNIEFGGNLLSLLSRTLRAGKNTEGQYTLFNIAYAQYVKGDFDYTRLVSIDTRNTLALHCGVGVAVPYGNSKILPFEKRYFSGGANSVRGWNVRELGPGKFRGTDGRIDFINQTGDIKLDLNMELRTALFWKFGGALFVDAGNIWTIKDYKEQPGGQFRIDEFYKQIAVAYGVGVRLNFDYFVVRFDLGMKALNPSYNSAREHYPIFHPNLHRDMSAHFAVGMPF